MLIEGLLETTRRLPNKIAAADMTRELTFAQLTTFARVMRRITLKETRCERVGVMLPASTAGLGTLLGVLWAGRTAVPLNFLLGPRELAAVIADAGIDLILTTQHFRPQLAAIPVRALYLEELGIKWRFVWERLRRIPEPPGLSPDRTAVIVYTSGSTGMPKGVCLSERNFHANVAAVIERLQFTPENHLLGILPTFHVFGLTLLTFLPALLGTAVTFIPRFSPQATYKVIAEGKVNTLLAVPSMYAAIARLKEIEPAKFANVRIAASGGEPLPRQVYEEVAGRTGVRLIEGYGLTETSPVISVDLPWAHKVGTVGPALPGVETQIRDANNHVLPKTDEGELWVRGPLVMQGYYHRPEETAAVIDAEGWFKTGDIVRMDADGYISITGRAKDLIIVAGENVYPREIETVLEEHPAVAEAAVLGQADGTRGETVVAFVTLKEGAEADAAALRAWCREHLAGYKVPRQVHIRPDLPRGPTGKVLKRELKTLLERHPAS